MGNAKIHFDAMMRRIILVMMLNMVVVMTMIKLNMHLAHPNKCF